MEDVCHILQNCMYRTKDCWRFFLQFCSSSLQLLATWRSWVIFNLYKVIVAHITLKALTALNPKFMKVNSKLVRK